jgi:hydrogenase nickel incorporation protein HypA/HybF
MHEAGIAASVLQIAEDEARKRGARSIRVVKVRVGEFSGIVADSLEFAFDALKIETLAADARLEMERIPLIARCPKCQESRRPESNLVLWCPQCSSPLEVIAGQELDVQYIEIEDGDLAEEKPAWNESA